MRPKLPARFLLSAIVMIIPPIAMAGCAGCLSRFLVRPTIHYEVVQDSPDSEFATAQSVTTEAKTLVPPQAGDILVFGGATGFSKPSGTAEFFDPNTKKFNGTGSMIQTRVGPIGTELATPLGKVLVAGGLTGSISVKKAVLTIKAQPTDIELYDPATGTFSSSGNLVTPRTGYTQTTLANGKILIAGGSTAGGLPTSAAEIFDPSTSASSATGNMLVPRMLHSATLLPDGTVLIAGGVIDTAGVAVQTAELYNPSTGKFTPVTGHLPVAMAGHTATLIEGCGCSVDGKVLLVGGFNGGGVASVQSANAVAVVYDPSTGKFTSTAGQPIDDRAFQSATLLSNGTVLIAGGLYGQSNVGNGIAFGIYGGVRASAEIYDPSTDSFTCVGGQGTTNCKPSMANSRAGHTATLMTSGPLAGQVLLVGGVGAKTTTSRGKGAALKSAELYDPVGGKFSATGSMKSARAGHGAVLLE